MGIRIIVLLFALTIGLTTTSKAAFVVKKEDKTEQATNNQTSALAVDNESISVAEASATAEPTAMASAAPTFGKARISKLAYVLLSVFFLGFVAVGLNDYWRGSSWIVCLVLCLLYLPGLIYALVSMPKYYHNKNKTFRY